jgi:hypothetical protein
VLVEAARVQARMIVVPGEFVPVGDGCPVIAAAVVEADLHPIAPGIGIGVVGSQHAANGELVAAAGDDIHRLEDAGIAVGVAANLVGVDLKELGVFTVPHHRVPHLVVEPIAGCPTVGETLPTFAHHAATFVVGKAALEVAVDQ